MVYQQKLVAVIKCNGKILREVDNTVLIPFLAEYEIFIKNLESRDAVIKISIDGEDVLDNQSIIIKANSSCSLEGFLKGNKVSNKFKFIQKTAKIQDHRGDRVDDGLVRIEYQFTKINQTITTTHRHVHDNHWYHPYWCDCPICRPYYIKPYVPFPFSPIVTFCGSTSGTTFGMSNANLTASVNSGNSSPGVENSIQASYSASGNLGAAVGSNNVSGPVKKSILRSATEDKSQDVINQAFMPQFDEGISVKGSESEQKLQEAWVSPLEDQSYTIVLRLRGCDSKSVPVEKPVLVSTKVKCSTCGRSNKSHIKFCPECGTALF